MAQVPTNVQYVSCLVHSGEDHCTFEQRLGWLLPLLSARLPLVLYACPKYLAAIRTHPEFQRVDHPDFELRPWRLSDSETWLRVAAAGDPVALQLPENRNAGKDTQFFLTLMNAKTELVARAAREARDSSKPFVAFLDAGIAKVFRDPGASFERLRGLQIRETVRESVILPGCWSPPPTRPQPSFEELSRRIDWTFCGGFFVLRAEDAGAFYRQTLDALQRFLLLGRLTWEVNVWVHMLVSPGPIRVQWFQADHDDRMTMVPAALRLTEGGEESGEDPLPLPAA